MPNFIQKEGRVRALRDINIRIGFPSIKPSVPTLSMPKGIIFDVIGYITDGDLVNGNALWYKNRDGNYIWSGNVELVQEEKQKILHAPLAHLICTQKFGERPEVYKNYGSPKGHNGLDFRTWVNNDPNKWEQPVYSVLDGIVSESAYDQKFKGNYVRIKHNNGCESVYLHFASRGVKQGEKVNASQEIGISGNSGSVSEAPHLHFGYRPTKSDLNNGYMGYINPTNLFINEIKYV